MIHRLLVMLLVWMSWTFALYAQQAPPVYVVSAGSIYNLPFTQGGGPDTPWPSLNFTVGDSSNGIAVTSALAASGGSVTFHGASNEVTPAVWRSIGGISIYIQGGPGTPYHLQWNCTASASVNNGSMGFFQTLVDTVGGSCAGDVSISVLSYSGPLSLQKSLTNGGTIDGTTSGSTITNPAFPGVTYSYATGLLGHWIYVAASSVGGSLNNGITYVGSASLDYTASFTANIVRPGQQPPTAVIDPLGQATVNVPVTLNGSNSYANTSGASLVAYNWTITDPGGTVIGTPAGPTVPNFLFPAAGTYSVGLTVTDSDGLTGSTNISVVASGNCGDERDTIIQEYVTRGVDFTPTCSDFTDAPQPSPHFSFYELKSPDASWAILRVSLLTGLEGMESLFHLPFCIDSCNGSGYRTPDWNFVIDPKHPDSAHVKGLAADIHTALGQFPWFILQSLAKQVGACTEPWQMSGLNYLHVDWRSSCPPGW